MRLLKWSLFARVFPFVVLDVAAVYGSYAGALLLRFDGSVPGDSWRVFWQVTPAIAVAFVAGNLVFGVYHTAWKYGGVRNFYFLAMAVASVTVIVTTVHFLEVAFSRQHFPLSVNLIGGGLIFLTMAGTKLWPHLNMTQFAGIGKKGRGKRVLIVGAGDTGQLVAREFLHNPQWEYRPVCFVDDDPKMMGVRIHGIPVAGNRYQIPELAARYRVDMVTLTMQAIPRRSFQELVQLCEKAKVSVNIIPSPEEILSGKVDRAVTLRFRT